jgi:predicted ATP-grasp superfamily ATP-dependent carboligase/protein-tyrosine-phosphatase
MRRPVLVLGSEPRIVVNIARSLHRRGIPVDVAALSPDTPTVSSRAIRKFIHLPDHQTAPRQFITELSALITSEQFDMLIPSSDTALTIVAEHYDELSKLLHVGCPAPHVVKRVLDKDLTLDVAAQHGIAIPETYPVETRDELDTLREKLSFPLIAKPRSKTKLGEDSFKIRYFQSFQELRAAFDLDAEFGARNLLQAYCPGEGVGIGMLMQGGEAVAAFQHRRLKEFPSTGGVSVLAISEALDPALMTAALTLLRALEWEGIAMVEFRYNRADRSAVLMEVNGRYWGTFSFAVSAGIDFPFYEWQLAHGETPDVPASYPVGIKWRWTAGYVQRLHSLFAASVKIEGLPPTPRWKEILASLSDFKPRTRASSWDSNDPAPALSEVSRMVKTLVKDDAKRVVRKMIPKAFVRHLRTYRGLEQPDRSSYLKLQLQRALKIRRDNLPAKAARVRSVLFVCHGNIIRSPMAAALLKQHLNGIEQPAIAVESAGLHAKQGRGVDSRALIAAKDLGVSLEDHRAQPLTDELVAEADAIFVMDYINEAKLLARYPKARLKVFMLDEFGEKGPAPQKEIADPYNGDATDVRLCYEILRSRIRLLTNLLSNGQK